MALGPVKPECFAGPEATGQSSGYVTGRQSLGWDPHWRAHCSFTVGQAPHKMVQLIRMLVCVWGKSESYKAFIHLNRSVYPGAGL